MDYLILDPIFPPRNITCIGTWSVLTLNQSKRLAQLLQELENYRLDILGLFESIGERRGIQGTVGPFASPEYLNGNHERMISFWVCNGLCVGNKYFQHRRIHKKTWISPDAGILKRH
ncbi:hypothetical protein ANCCAN_21034 [Ancylostoma caninum]|uniref:Uncharacterized protein n=1 Tax=Ancylostoma caninum TaxID=29170 RepID=A0A368FLX5_ANCCA|nr:hypothetical protein ANCCAN_21034 [Ancylostoma caninum]